MKDQLLQKPLSRSLLWLTGLMLVLAAVPHWNNLHPLIGGTFLGLIFLRYTFWPRPETIPPGWLRLLLLPACLVLVVYGAGWSEGRQFGVALLVLMSGMKVLEMHNRRDLYIAVFLGYFVLVTLFLFHQSPLLTLYVLAVSLGFTALLMATNIAGNSLPWKTLLGKSITMILASMPVMILLFVLFPRLSGPLWSLNLGSSSGISGMSDTISMGSISSLSQSTDVAFRVRFQVEPPPPPQRYWRGMVLWQTDGRNWTRGENIPRTTSFLPGDETWSYEITMEASGQPWLFPLDHVVTPGNGLKLNRDGEVSTNKPINSRKTYTFISSAPIQSGRLSSRERQWGLQLPAGISTRTRELAQRFRSQASTDEAVIQAALTYFNREAFVYTLQPPLLRNDPVDEFLFTSRRGFCEHFATSFVVLMRLAGIPARVVVGYQGGQLNPMGGHLVVRQSDAHAWAEVWLEGRGWVRIDPTAAVAPERVEYSIETSNYASGAAVNFTLSQPPELLARLARNFRWLQDNLQLSWHYWVVGFDSSRQQQLLQKMGLDNLQGYELGVAASLGALAAGTLVFLLGMKFGRRKQDPAQKAYRLFLKKLYRSGLRIPPSTGPQVVLQKALRHCPEKAAEIQAIMQQYMSLRYGKHPRKDIVRALGQRVKKFRCRSTA